MRILLLVVLMICSVGAFAQAQQQTGNVKGITPARALALGTAVVGILSVVIGWRARSRVAAGQANRSLSITAVVIAFVAVIVSSLHLANVTGGFGTGGGKAGAIGALVMGIIGGSLGTLALTRAKS
jgi:hypothetical protein